MRRMHMCPCRHAKKAMQSHASTAPHPPPMQLAARRVIIVSNHLPLRTKRGAAGWEFEWDEDALVAQAKVRHLGSAALPRTLPLPAIASAHACWLGGRSGGSAAGQRASATGLSSHCPTWSLAALLLKDGIPTELDVLYVGTLPIEASPEEEEVRLRNGPGHRSHCGRAATGIGV